MSAAKVLPGGTPKSLASAGTAAWVRSKRGPCCSGLSDVTVEDGACSE